MDACLRLLEKHRLRYPSGDLAEEAALLKIQTLLQQKKFRRVFYEASIFQRRFPHSLKALQVSTLRQRAQDHLQKNAPEHRLR